MEISKDLITYVLTFIAGGGLIKLLTLWDEKKSIKMDVKKKEFEADLTGINSVEGTIGVYKQTLEDFKSYFDQRELVLKQNNELLSNQVKELLAQIKELKESNRELSLKLQQAEDNINRLEKSLNK